MDSIPQWVKVVAVALAAIGIVVWYVGQWVAAFGNAERSERKPAER
ncbi:MAG: hypothetical protein V1916_01260 [Patescibacteria group bacterium]